MTHRLSREFFERPTLEVAPELLGKVLVSQTAAGKVAGEITEVEAYLGEVDPASHAFAGQTKRNQAMWLSGGHWYVYFIYGMHFCLNIVTELEGKAGAILIRGVKPIEGLELIQQRRGVVKPAQLTNGPAKVVQAFGISPAENGTNSLKSPKLWLEDRGLKPDVATSRRIGISKGVEHEWRFTSQA